MIKQMQSTSKRQVGFTVVEILATLAIGAVISAAAMAGIVWTAKNQSKAMSISNLMAFQQSMMQNLSNATSWNNTIFAGSRGGSLSNMLCLYDANTACPAVWPGPNPILPTRPGGQLFDLYDAGANGGTLMYQATNLNAGIDMRGRACNGFVYPPGAGNDACPFRFDLRWTTGCTAAPCIGALIKINAKLLVNPSPNSVLFENLNADLYSINDYYVSLPNLSPAASCSGGSLVLPAAQSGSWAVPANYKMIVVEMWGAGGGGSAASSPWSGGCWLSPGADGGSTIFNGVTAAGGAGQTQPGDAGKLGGTNVINECIWSAYGPICASLTQIDCAQTGLYSVGGWSFPANAVTTPPVVNTCNASTANATGTVSGGSGVGGLSCGANGNPPGGGGAGSCAYTNAVLFGGSGWLWQKVWTDWGAGAGNNGSNGEPQAANQGQYVRKVYTAGQLSGSVPYTVGKGGAGGNSSGMQGGNGADGFIKITWE
jgi:prepilin-type N-terminal cleavage/methylation domain-containing protein